MISDFQISAKKAGGYEAWRASYLALGFWEAVRAARPLVEEYRRAERAGKKTTSLFRKTGPMQVLDCSNEARWMNKLRRQRQSELRARQVDEWLKGILAIADTDLRSRVAGMVAWDFILGRVGMLVDLESLILEDADEVPRIECALELVRLGYLPLDAYTRVYQQGNESLVNTRGMEDHLEQFTGLLSVI